MESLGKIERTQLGFKVRLQGDMGTVRARVTEALKSEGFGVLTEIDVKETMKKKLGVDYDPFVILGACNPVLAHRALSAAPEVSLLLPCNVVVRELREGGVAVALVDPMEMMNFVGVPELQALAQEARAKMERVATALLT